jgi:hypothetical protein
MKFMAKNFHGKILPSLSCLPSKTFHGKDEN